jgi:hypothetical protein
MNDIDTDIGLGLSALEYDAREHLANPSSTGSRDRVPKVGRSLPLSRLLAAA